MSTPTTIAVRRAPAPASPPNPARPRAARPATARATALIVGATLRPGPWACRSLSAAEGRAVGCAWLSAGPMRVDQFLLRFDARGGGAATSTASSSSPAPGMRPSSARSCGPPSARPCGTARRASSGT